jgi:hypothetical protein
MNRARVKEKPAASDEAAVRRRVLSFCDVLEVAIALARFAARSREPQRGALLLVTAHQDLRADLRALRAIALRYTGAQEEPGAEDLLGDDAAEVQP